MFFVSARVHKFGTAGDLAALACTHCCIFFPPPTKPPLAVCCYCRYSNKFGDIKFKYGANEVVDVLNTGHGTMQVRPRLV